MSIKIRLARGGRTKLPLYRIVVANSTASRDGKFIEKIGTYNPLFSEQDERRVTLKKERVEYWLSVGAKPTERVAVILCALGIKGADKYKPNFTPKVKGTGAKKKALAAAAAAAANTVDANTAVATAENAAA